MPAQELRSRALGYFSVGLGTIQVLAPGAVAQLIGVRGGTTSNVLIRLVGLRELAAGVGLLMWKPSSGWLWARVGGDVMDVALVSASVANARNQRGRLAATLSALGSVTAVDVRSAQATSRGYADGDGIAFKKAITIRRAPEDVYRFWRDFRQFPTFMSHLESVAVLDERRSHWTAKGPAGRLRARARVEWDAEITDDRPNERIAWSSLPGAVVDNVGSVRFVKAPGERGTEVHVNMAYSPPGGGLGATLARLFGQEPRQQVQADLRKLKQVLEAGEVVRSSATLEGTHLFQRPAQPLAQSWSTEVRA
ncbi:MAG: SRPBCC family protein [Chloroflexi bacterium]|nr:SRPBCC family protein [Chloroflexota bacterium]